MSLVVLGGLQAGSFAVQPEAVVARAVRMAVAGEVTTADGEVVPCRVASICVHGDTPGAVTLAGRVRAGLDSAGLRVTAFA